MPSDSIKMYMFYFEKKEKEKINQISAKKPEQVTSNPNTLTKFIWFTSLNLTIDILLSVLLHSNKRSQPKVKYSNGL